MDIRDIMRIDRPDLLVALNRLNLELKEQNSAWLEQRREQKRQQDVQILFWSQ